MKKIIYYRACKDKKGFIFNSDTGYLINFYNGSAAIDLVFGKNQYNLWTITELSTGFLVHNSTFFTRKEAIEAVTGEYLKKIIDKLVEWNFYPDAVQRLAEYRAAHPI